MIKEKKLDYARANQMIEMGTLLTNSEIIQFIELAKMGDQKAKEIVIMQNRGIVRKIAHQYEKNSYFSFDELCQYGYISILKTIHSYNVEKGYFSTYIESAIRNEIVHAICELQSLIKLNWHDYIDWNKIQKQKRRKELEEKREISLDELVSCATLDVSEKRLKQLREIFECDRYKVGSYNVIVSNEENGASESELHELIPDFAYDSESMFEELEHKLEQVKLKEILRKVLDQVLDAKQKKILYFKMAGVAVKTIASEFGISDKRVYQIEEKALNKIRNSDLCDSLIPFTQDPIRSSFFLQDFRDQTIAKREAEMEERMRNNQKIRLTQDQILYYVDLVQMGDQKAQDFLTRYNRNIIEKLARKYESISNLSYEDLVRYGRIELCKIVENYTLEKGDFCRYIQKMMNQSLRAKYANLSNHSDQYEYTKDREKRKVKAK